VVRAWHQGMSRPLPLACKTAFAWLSREEDPASAALEEYEGGYNRAGEVQQDAYLARAFPDFAALLADQAGGGFEHWLGLVYAPLWQTWRQGEGA